MKVREAQHEDAPAMGRVFLDSYRDAHRDHIPEEILLKGRSYEQSAESWARAIQEIATYPETRECIYVAQDDAGQILGVAMGGPEHSHHPLFTAEVYVLYVHPAHHRRGIGRLLLEAVAARLADHGLSSLAIRVLKPNIQARRFYEALGGQLIQEEPYEEEGIVLSLVVYGWTDIHVLFPHSC